MILNELFDQGPVKIKPASSTYGLYNLLKAYEFDIAGSLYVCYMDEGAGRGRPNTLGFMKVTDEESRGTHALTNDNIPFKVFSAVIRCVHLFVDEFHPETMYIRGWDDTGRQHELYRKMLLHYRSKLPSPYFLAQRGDGTLFISRDEHLADKEGPHLQLL